MDNFEYELYHHGVKGMKWGVRKKKEDRYVSRFQAHRNASKAAKESREADIKNGVSSISTMQRHATLAKAKSKLADAEHNQNLRESRQAARKADKQAKKAEKEFRREVDHAKKYGIEADYELDTKTGELTMTQFYNSKRQKIGQEYAQRIIDALIEDSQKKKVR